MTLTCPGRGTQPLYERKGRFRRRLPVRARRRCLWRSPHAELPSPTRPVIRDSASLASCPGHRPHQVMTGPCRLVPRRAAELGLRGSGVSARTSPSPSVSFDPLEVPLKESATTPKPAARRAKPRRSTRDRPGVGRGRAISSTGPDRDGLGLPCRDRDGLPDAHHQWCSPKSAKPRWFPGFIAPEK